MIFNVGSGSTGKLVHLHISYDPSLAGANITATNGSEVYTAVADISGLTVISGTKLGEWTVSEDMFGTSAVISTTFYGNYNAGLGGGVFITVNVENEFIGKTLTLTNGSKTYTRVASGSSVLFVVADYGTWTVSGVVAGETYSSSIEVTEDGNYSMELSVITEITINFNVYSAVSDTVYYIENGSQVTLCTTDSTGKGTATLTIPSNGLNLTLFSTVADNPNDTTQKYTKDIVITKNTNNIYLMPELTVYWYGYIRENCVLTQKHYYDTSTKSLKTNASSFAFDMKTNNCNATNTTDNTLSYCDFQFASEIRAKSSHLIAKRSGTIATSGLAKYANVSCYTVDERPDDQAVGINASLFNTIPVNTPYHAERVYSSVNDFKYADFTSGDRNAIFCALWFEN